MSVLLALIDIFITVAVDGMGTKFDYYSYRLDNILLALMAWSLYHLFSSAERKLSLTALILSIVRVAIPFIKFPSGTFSMIWIPVSLIPILLFGILAYRYPQLGMPRILAVIGISYPITQAIFYILYRSFSDLNLGFVDNLPLVLNLTWLIWTGVILLFGKLYKSPDGVNRRGLYKEVIVAIGAIFLILVSAVIYNKIHTATTPTIATPVGYGIEFPFELDPIKEWGENVNITCEDSIDQTFLDPDTARKLVAAGGKLDTAIGENTPSYLWTGNVPLDLFVEPEDDGSGFGKAYYYWGKVYCITGLTGAKVDANGLGPNIYVITKITPFK
jgi:hypothetical protein